MQCNIIPQYFINCEEASLKIEDIAEFWLKNQFCKIEIKIWHSSAWKSHLGNKCALNLPPLHHLLIYEIYLLERLVFSQNLREVVFCQHWSIPRPLHFQEKYWIKMSAGLCRIIRKWGGGGFLDVLLNFLKERDLHERSRENCRKLQKAFSHVRKYVSSTRGESYTARFNNS